MPAELNITLYLLIFGSKLIENALGTFRLILVANGRKKAAAFLQFFLVSLWLITTGAVLANIENDAISILAFGLGAGIGSYLGGVLEEKLALGNHLVISIADNAAGDELVNTLRQKGFAVTTTDGTGSTQAKRKILFIVSKRKNQVKLFNLIKKIDSSSMIITEPVNNISGGKIRK